VVAFCSAVFFFPAFIIIIIITIIFKIWTGIW